MNDQHNIYKKDRKIVFPTILFMFLFCFGYSQKKNFKFKHYGKQDGLNQSSVNYIYQDSKDYLWIANFGGINKFDGYNFTSYTNAFGDSTSIPDNSVWTILETTDKTLWLGTKAGLSKYNRAQDNFTNYFVKTKDSLSGTLAVKALFEDTLKRFYIGTEGEGLFLFSKEKKTFTHLDIFPKHGKISAMTEDLSGNLWIGTENLGLFKIDANRSNIISFRDTKTFLSKTIWSLYADKKGNTWIGTDVDGLVKYNDSEQAFITFKNQQQDHNYQAGDKIKFITKTQDNLWIASATNGLSYYSYSTKKFYNYKTNVYDSNSLFDNDVSGIFSGANNVLYVGFYTKGFDKLTPSPFKILRHNPKDPQSLSNNNVYSMLLDHENTLWCGTFGGGLNAYNTETNQFKHYRHQKDNPQSISHDWVRIIFEDREQQLWVGTWGGGLNKFDRKTGVFKRYLPDANSPNSLNHNIITALFQDNDGELWVGTYGGGINIYQPQTDDFKSIVHDKHNVNSLSDDHITSFYQDKDGLIWICTYGGGLNSYDKVTGTFERFLPNTRNKFSLNSYKTLHIIDEPNKDYVWITTLGGGINKFYYKEKKFENFTEKDGLSNNSTMGMLPDHKNNYWISSNTGISYFDPIQETFTNYTTIDGLASDDYNLEAYAKTPDGTLYFGGKKGITYFNPKDVYAENKFPRVAFTTIKVDERIYTDISNQITIPYNTQCIIEYAAINANKTTNIKYAYQLEGRDNAWNVMTKNRYLEFKNLAPGYYRLKVKSTNSNHVWNEQYAHISLYVPTPWYMSWYFKGSLLCLLVLLAYSYYKVKIKSAEELNKLLEQKVQERTKTIAEKTDALQTEKEKTEDAYKQLKKLENFKNEFTGMLAHDLKNPLTVILGYSADNTDSHELKVIHKSGKTMLQLIENMLEAQKFEYTEVQLNLNSVNLNALALEVVSQIDVLLYQKRIQVLTKINPEFTVYADKDIIERVFVNLLSNAIKFSDQNSIIELLAEPNDDGKQIIVSVKDYGSGIPEDKLSSIFTKFSQVEARQYGMTKSTGLGLAFCKMAVEAHKGRIWVNSKINEGSEFFFNLPRLENSFIEINTNKQVHSEDPPVLKTIAFTLNDKTILKSFSEKIAQLHIHEIEQWFEIFDALEEYNETENIKQWKQLMLEALTRFNEQSFSHLKQLATDIS